MNTLIVNLENNTNIEQIISAISMLKGIKNVTTIDNWDNWSDLDETNYLCSISGMKESILEEGKTPLEECVPLEEIWSDV